MQAQPAARSVSQKKLLKRLRRLAGQAIEDYAMIEPGDRVMVCLSGGKDSYTMLDILLALQAAAPVPFELHAVNLDQKQPEFPEQVLPDYARELGVPLHVIEQDTYSVVKRVIPEGKIMCGLCSRLRRGALYQHAREQGYTKIALGHHRDDILETLFLNLFHGGRLASMPARLQSQDGTCTVIRPLAYCTEKDIARYASMREFPIIPCRLCGSQENSQRLAVKRQLREWDREHPGRLESMFRALSTVVPSHLMDRELHDFTTPVPPLAGGAESVDPVEAELEQLGGPSALPAAPSAVAVGLPAVGVRRAAEGSPPEAAVGPAGSEPAAR